MHFRNRPELNYRNITPSYAVNESGSNFAMLSIELWFSEIQF